MSVWANVPARPRHDGRLEQLVVVGSGPAGCTAAIYAARAKHAPLVIAGATPGGLLQEAGVVENFPGHPGGVPGPLLAADLRAQAERFGARFLDGDALAITPATEPGLEHLVLTDEGEIRSRVVILAMGACPRPLGVPGESELRAGGGVAYCAVCEAPLYEGRRTVVVGGGDSAMEEALGLARHAQSVVLVHRRSTFRAAPIMLERVRANERIEIRTPYLVTALEGEGGTLVAAALEHAQDGTRERLPVDGAFIAVGHEPHSALLRDRLALDEHGHVRCLDHTTATSAPGVFACGDLVDGRYRQAVTAAGSGCAAALDAQAYLQGLEGPAAVDSASGQSYDARNIRPT